MASCDIGRMYVYVYVYVFWVTIVVIQDGQTVLRFHLNTMTTPSRARLEQKINYNPHTFPTFGTFLILMLFQYTCACTLQYLLVVNVEDAQANHDRITNKSIKREHTPDNWDEAFKNFIQRFSEDKEKVSRDNFIIFSNSPPTSAQAWVSLGIHSPLTRPFFSP